MTSEKYLARKRADLSRRERDSATRFREAIDVATKRYDREMKRLTGERKRYEAWKDEPLVWVRAFHAGPPPQVFHTSYDCGWCPVGSEQMLRGEAIERRLRRCSSDECREQDLFHDAA